MNTSIGYRSRRDFMQKSSMAIMGLAFPWGITGESFDLAEPFDGDLMHPSDGKMDDGQLSVTVKAVAPRGRSISINGSRARYRAGAFYGDVALRDYRNTIEAYDEKSGIKKAVTVYKPAALENRYRLSIDDAVWFLKDIHLHADAYDSIFDNPFLGFLKRLHDTRGTKVHLNIFYETDGFNLSQMTDRFRNEWKANASWLRLSFHAKAELPDDPYKHSGYAQVRTECGQVIEQISRFAGEALNSSITTLHWGEVPVEVCRALRDAGYTGQLCDFNVDDHQPPCSYYLDVPQRRHINKRFLWRDNREDIIFIKSGIIINSKSLAEIAPFLNRYAMESRRPPYLDLLVHEQYFYRDYHNYQPDYCEKVTEAVDWAIGNGYTPAFLSECIYT